MAVAVMSDRHTIFIVLLLVALVGIGVGWWLWDDGLPPVSEAVVEASTTAPTAALPSSATLTQPSNPALACTDCGQSPDDPALAEAARRSDFYQAYADRLRAEPVEELARQWRDVLARHDPDELPAFLGVFAESLRKAKEATAIYEELASILNDPSATPFTQAAVLTLLGKTATTQAMQILIDCLFSGNLAKEETIQTVLLDNIRKATMSLVDGHWNWDTSPILENAWLQRETLLSANERQAIAQNIAFLSTDEGARTLFETLDATTGVQDEDRDIAATALASLKNNNALPALQEVLNTSQSNPELTSTALRALFNIGSPDAYIVLTDYLSTATLDTAQQTLLQTLLAENQQSIQTRDILKDVLENQPFAQETTKTLLENSLNTQTSFRESLETEQEN